MAEAELGMLLRFAGGGGGEDEGMEGVLHRLLAERFIPVKGGSLGAVVESIMERHEGYTE